MVIMVYYIRYVLFTFSYVVENISYWPDKCFVRVSVTPIVQCRPGDTTVLLFWLRFRISNGYHTRTTVRCKAKGPFTSIIWSGNAVFRRKGDTRGSYDCDRGYPTIRPGKSKSLSRGRVRIHSSCANAHSVLPIRRVWFPFCTSVFAIFSYW